MSFILIVLSGIAGYLLGSINSSIIVGKLYRIDIRQYGSGNAGMTNTLRTLGKKAAFFVLIGDILKGILSYLIGLILAGSTGAMMAGTCAILGHNWPIYFGFRGGKGALTSIAVLFMMNAEIALILLIVFVITVALTRYVSLGSMIGAALFPVLAIAYKQNIGFVIFALVIGLLVILRHHSNIVRILNGTESKLDFRKLGR